MTNVDLARKAGLTAPPCLRRVRALEEAGVIESYHARLNAASLGYGIMVFALVSLRWRVGRCAQVLAAATQRLLATAQDSGAAA